MGHTSSTPIGYIDFRLFWGKAQPQPDAQSADAVGAPCPFHPVAWHGLDVAAVFLALLEAWPDEARALEGTFEGGSPAARRALAVLVALHDVGKFAPAFQAKAPEQAPSQLAPLPINIGIDHGATGLAYLGCARYLKPLLDTLLPQLDDDARWAVLQPVLGHHGRPLADAMILAERDGRRDGPSAEAARAFMDEVLDLFGRPELPRIGKGQAVALSWRLAGLVALADWIGSSQTCFPYTAADLAFADYWALAQERATQAVAVAGLRGAPVSQMAATEAVTRGDFALTDAQRWAAEVSLDEDAGLFIIEDMMGSGKTEAALILAHRLMQGGRAGGLYVALPTMATANALYRRMAGIHRRLFMPDASPSLILAHGARDLDEQFRSSIGLESLAPEAVPITASEDDEDASEVACARWLADDRRKTFLADVGVGTIDQALLGMLPVKHCAVRQLGLRRRVLIIDEAHAYDAYMQKEIEGLIRHQASMNAPVIVLSATLPSLIQARLTKAWRDARKLPDVSDGETAYPLATVLGTTGARQTRLAPRADLVREVAIMRLPDHAAADALVVKAARQGAAVARLCNTVDDAIAAWRRLTAQGIEAELFHARFAMCDRIAIEQAAMARFGKSSQPEQRRGRVLVATQVIEQSLDVDFDLMVSDLAPVDLLLQRMGRVWRHTSRQERGWGQPTLAVLSPEAVPDAAADWYGALFPIGQYVYPDHARLWRTARLLFGGDRIKAPDDMRPLVEQVYADDLADVPDGLAASLIRTSGKDMANRGHASLNLLKLQEGYSLQGGLWQSDIRTPTRLSDNRTTLRLARISEGRLAPYAQTSSSRQDPRQAWALSELSVSTRRISGRGGYDRAIEKQAAALDALWEREGVKALCLPLLEEGEGGSFVIRTSNKSHEPCKYAEKIGLFWAL
jgi:CRISPR-associated endonuclease/helicase Cas3